MNHDRRTESIAEKPVARQLSWLMTLLLGVVAFCFNMIVFVGLANLIGGLAGDFADPPNYVATLALMVVLVISFPANLIAVFHAVNGGSKSRNRTALLVFVAFPHAFFVLALILTVAIGG